MNVIYKNESVELIHGDCMIVMDDMIQNNMIVDCSIVDIPYGNVSKNGEERAKYAGQLRNINKEEADIVTFDEIEFSHKLAQVTNSSIYIF